MCRNFCCFRFRSSLNYYPCSRHLQGESTRVESEVFESRNMNSNNSLLSMLNGDNSLLSGDLLNLIRSRNSSSGHGHHDRCCRHRR